MAEDALVTIENTRTGERYPATSERYTGDNGEKLRCAFDYERITLTRDIIDQRRHHTTDSFQVYKELMPVFPDEPLVAPKFGPTPFEHAKKLSKKLGVEVFIKYPMYYVTGSHKPYHLVPAANYTTQVRRRNGDKRPIVFANYSCGNAGDAASYVANLFGLPIKVFLLGSADHERTAPLTMRGSEVYSVSWDERVTGDPSYYMFKEAVRRGAIPLACAGPDNFGVVEGGKVMFLEAMEQSGWRGFDHAFVQVGGGLLANAFLNAYDDALALGLLPQESVPAFHTVQTEACYPLRLAYQRVMETNPRTNKDVTCLVCDRREEMLKPWEAKEEPESVAHGILDVETYEGAELIAGMYRTGGKALIVCEDELMDAWRLGARATGHFASPTGTSGLAGLLRAIDEGIVDKGESVLLTFTGIGQKQLSTTKEVAEPVKVNPVDDIERAMQGL